MSNSMNNNSAFDANHPQVKKFVAGFLSPWKQRFFLLAKLPSAWFMGLRVVSLNAEKCEVTLPYSWWSQNPFKSIYFAAQAAAAEFSTGLISMMALQGKGAISMLVADMKGEFLKKATKKTTFTCSDTQKIFDAVARAIETGEGQTVTVESVGVQADGVVVSRFSFTWTFKAKKQ